MAKKKRTSIAPIQSTMFDVHAVARVIDGKPVKREVTDEVKKFDHMAYGINRAFLAGESIVVNRGNKVD